RQYRQDRRLTDMSGLYADLTGTNAVLAVKMAVEDSGWRDDQVAARPSFSNYSGMRGSPCCLG
ncbi:MAG: hypothetical protein WAV18_12935, partial [Roseiarcus sp.]